ncbi:hypothetical protein KDN32_03280 [Nocardioides sp. J2M5]|uniref:hypothetical protein n=1 Tax=Nocardioides palaemonis TaxID=2829810 RepID=UPI001BAB0B34|nr:hypothetical protein [Nocardioides palaemonis]MBS2936762.1 hypothetical protein [Nocardioides palaemonis]
MSSRRPVRQLLVAVLLGVLVGGGLMAVTPAGAEVSQAAATSWKKIWKKELKPLAAKTFYTKKQSDAAYQPKGSYEPAGSGYTKAESDAKYAGAGSGYTKAESDGRYLPKQALIRGQYAAIGTAAAANDWVGDNITFGVTLSAAPTPHYLAVGAAPTADCPGTAAAPNAAPGQLCFYERQDINAASRFVFDAASGTNGAASPYGASMYVSAAAAGDTFVYGSWAVRPLGITAASLGKGGGGAALTAPSVP